MGREKWEFNTAWDWVRPFPNGDVLYDVTDSANILGAPAYTQKEYLNEIDWKNNESMEAFQRFIDDRDREPWQNTRFLSTIQPGMEFGNGDTAYKIVTGTDKRLIPKGYEIAGTLDSVYRPGYSRVSGQILNNPVEVASTTIPGYTILQKTSSDSSKEKTETSKKPIDFSPRYIKPEYHKEPTLGRQVSSQSFDQLLASKSQNEATDEDIRRALSLD